MYRVGGTLFLAKKAELYRYYQPVGGGGRRRGGGDRRGRRRRVEEAPLLMRMGAVVVRQMSVAHAAPAGAAAHAPSPARQVEGIAIVVAVDLGKSYFYLTCTIG